jgi:hypothetical protein
VVLGGVELWSVPLHLVQRAGDETCPNFVEDIMSCQPGCSRRTPQFLSPFFLSIRTVLLVFQVFGEAGSPHDDKELLLIMI